MSQNPGANVPSNPPIMVTKGLDPSTKNHRGNPCNPAAPPSTSASTAVGYSTAISTWEVSLVVATRPNTSDMNTKTTSKLVTDHLISVENLMLFEQFCSNGAQ
jgi:hypothetical protein